MMLRIRYVLAIMGIVWIVLFSQLVPEKAVLPVYLGFAAVLVFLLVLAKQARSFFTAGDIPLLLFIVSFVPGLFVAVDRSLAFKLWYSLAAGLAVFYCLGIFVFTGQPGFKVFAAVIASSILLVSGWALFEIVARYDPVYQAWVDNPYYQRYITGEWVRPMAGFFNPAVLATYLVSALPFAVFLIGEGDRRMKLLGVVGTVVGAAILGTTFCRSSIAGLFAAALVYLLLKKRFAAFWAAAACLLAVVLLSSFLPYPFSRIGFRQIFLEGTALFSDYRLTRLQIAFSMLKDSNFIGVGIDNFRALFDYYYPGYGFDPFHAIDYEWKITDNMYITLLAESGLIGLCSFFLLVFSLIRKKVIGLLREPESRRADADSVFVAAMTGFCVSIIGYDGLYWKAPLLLFGLLCGLMAASNNKGSRCR